MAYYVYILHSDSRQRYYVGSTVDLAKRVAEHNSAIGGFTHTGRPWKLVHSEIFTEKTEALKREKYLKRMKSAKFLRSLIDNGQKTPDA